MADERFTPMLRELACCFQALEQLSGRHVRTLGLTPSQFDIVVTLGRQNGAGMTCGELGDQTLITKGTLTGVLDRLELKQLIQREESREDRRSVIVRLTPAGEALCTKVFSQHLDYLRPAFSSLDDRFMAELTGSMQKLRKALQQYGESNPPQDHK